MLHWEGAGMCILGGMGGGDSSGIGLGLVKEGGLQAALPVLHPVLLKVCSPSLSVCLSVCLCLCLCPSLSLSLFALLN